MWVSCREAESFLVNSTHTHTHTKPRYTSKKSHCEAGVEECGLSGRKQQKRRCEEDERSCCVSIQTCDTESSGAIIRSLTQRPLT